MKNIIFAFLLSFVTVFAFGQTKDTTYTVNENGVFYKVRSLEYSNLNKSLTYEYIGDSSATFGYYQNLIESRLNDMAIEVQSVANFTKGLNQITATSTRTLGISGKNILDTLQAQNEAWYLNGTWTLAGEAAGSVTFTKTNAGQLRYKIDAGSVRNATPYGKQAVILIGYPAVGQSTIFYFDGQRRMIRPDNKVRLVRSSATVARK